MLWQIVKKQGLILLRNPQQLLLLIGLPIILISILGASLGSFMNGEAIRFDAKVAFIEHDDEQQQIKRFIQEVNDSQLPEEAATAIRKGVEQFKPVQILKEDVFGELKDVVQLETVQPEEKARVIGDESYTAVIEIPKNFTYDTLRHLFLNEETSGVIQIHENEGKQIGSTIVREIINQYQEQITLTSFAGKQGIATKSLQINPDVINGEIMAINKRPPVTAKNYYAIGMAVMNVLYIASTIGSYAFHEKKTHVFNRVILADLSRWIYFIGIFITGSIFAFLHLLIVFGVSWIIFGVTWPNVLGFFIVTLGVAIAVGGLAVLLTAISYRINSEQITNAFQSVIVTIFAFVGGSFFPIGDFSKDIQIIGNFTPNGAGMTAYLSLLRGYDISSIFEHMLFLVIFAVTLIIVAALSFPKRGQTI